MDLLVLGGTRFVGRHLVEAALSRGHRVTLFHRGQRGPGLFPEAEHLIGDRAGDLAPLAGRRWDAVVDTSGYVPAQVRASAERLAGAVGLYAFVSTISVYADPTFRPLDEDAPLHPPDPEGTEVTGPAYGPMKVACEEAVRAAFPGRALVVRPGLVVGPHDYTYRFPYWVHRLAEGGDVLAPGHPERPVQVIDARDLGAWTLSMVERGAGGVFNATGPALPMRALLEAVREGAGSDARLVWVPDDVLLAHGVQPWTEMPLWETHPAAALMETDSRRARAAGLACRPVAETARDTLAADRARTSPEERAGGMAREKEAEILGSAGVRSA